jgi:hypothetical protein
MRLTKEQQQVCFDAWMEAVNKVVWHGAFISTNGALAVNALLATGKTVAEIGTGGDGKRLFAAMNALDVPED